MNHYFRLLKLILFVLAICQATIALAGLSLTVPIYDDQTWTNNCEAQVNGTVVLDPPGSTDIKRVEWDWGDGIIYDQLFPAYHLYPADGDYDIKVTAYDLEDNSETVTFQLSISECVYQNQSGVTFLYHWGSYGQGPGQFGQIQGIAVDSNGNVFVTDRVGHRIQKFDALGNYHSSIGEHGSEPGQFMSPNDIAFDSSGDMYVTDEGNCRIQKFDPSGGFLLEWGSCGSAPNEFNEPWGISVNKLSFGDYIYVVDSLNYRVQVFFTNGVLVGEFGVRGSGDTVGQFVEFDAPRGIVFDRFNNMFFTDDNNHRIGRGSGDDPEGQSFWWGSEGSGESEFLFPVSVATDQAGNVFVGDSETPWVQKFDNYGNYLGKFGTPGRGPGLGGLQPGIAVGPTGLIYVTDRDNSLVYVFGAISQVEINPSVGGEIDTDDGQVEMTIPPDALTEPTTISVQQTSPDEISADLQVGTSTGQGEVLAAYNLEPDGLVFDVPVELSMTIDVTAFNAGQRDKLDIYLLTDTDADGTPDTFVAQGAVCSVSEGPVFLATCVVHIMHFSTYALIAPVDSDEDGVSDTLGGEQDQCPGTVIPESVPTMLLGKNRWALTDGDTVFDTNAAANQAPGNPYTIAETAGCSCGQIIDAMGLGKGQLKFGCSSSVMESWISSLNP